MALYWCSPALRCPHLEISLRIVLRLEIRKYMCLICLHLTNRKSHKLETFWHHRSHIHFPNPTPKITLTVSLLRKCGGKDPVAVVKLSMCGPRVQEISWKIISLFFHHFPLLKFTFKILTSLLASHSPPGQLTEVSFTIYDFTDHQTLWQGHLHQK